MVYLHPYTNERRRLVKWYRLSGYLKQSAIERLHLIQKLQPANTPRLIRFGLTENRLYIEFEYIPAQSLFHALHVLTPRERESATIALLKQSEIWRDQGFIHGDISLRNTLVERAIKPSNLRLWYIDWLIDLESRAGTPFYAAPEVFEGRRSIETDQHAFKIIASQISKRSVQ